MPIACAAPAVVIAISVLATFSPAVSAAAPACENWFYPTEDFGIQQDNGIVATAYLRDGVFHGPARHTVAGRPDVTGGTVSGDVNGRRVDIFVDWHNGVTNHYYGQIADDGTASGVTLNSRVQENRWTSLAKFYCPAPPLGDVFLPPPGVQDPVGPTAAFEPPPGVQGPVDATAPFVPPPGIQDLPAS